MTDRQYKTNTYFLVGYISVIGLSTMQFGQVLCTNSAVGPIIGERLEWQNTNKTDTIIASVSVLGLAIGSFAGGFMIKNGRRRILILMNIISIIAVSVQLILNFWAFLLGKLLWALAVGVLSTVGPVMVEENVPAEQVGFWALSTNFFIVIGIAVSDVLGLGLPQSNSPEVYTSEYWRVIYGSPLVNTSILLFFFIFIFKTDTIKYHITKKESENALIMIKQVYAKDEDHEKILQEMLDLQEEIERNKLTLPSLKACVSDDGLWQPQWVCFIQALFNQFTGSNGINVYSVTIFTTIQEQGGSLNPTLGVQLIALAAVLGCLLSPFTIKYTTRRQLFIGCYALMALEMFALGLFIYLNISSMILLSMFSFVITYNCTTGPATWIYTGEVCNEKQFGLVVMAIFLGVEIMALFMNSLINSSLHSAGTFWLFSVSCALATVFLFFTMKETKGLTKEQQRTLYFKDKSQKFTKSQKSTISEESSSKLLDTEDENINTSKTRTPDSILA